MAAENTKGPVGRQSRRAVDEASTCGVFAPNLSRSVGALASDGALSVLSARSCKWLNTHLPLAGGDLRRVFNLLREAPPSS